MKTCDLHELFYSDIREIKQDVKKLLAKESEREGKEKEIEKRQVAKASIAALIMSGIVSLLIEYFKR
jgi:hypothetical protein